MAITILPTSEVRDKISSVLKRLSETGEPVFITRYSKAEAVLLPIDRYNAMMDLLEDREDELDTALGRRLQEEREAHARGEGRDFEAFVAELE
ncbi:MAG: type II toxin-antitoxin system Phd/YefM family antitoxin [Nitrospinota bacterium]